MTRFRFLSSLAVCTVATLSLAQRPSGNTLKDAPPLLQKAFGAFKKLRYSGTRIVEYKRGPDRVRHTEYVIADGPRSRVEFPTGSRFAGQVVVEADGRRMHYFPDRNEIHVLPARREQAVSRLLGMPHRGGKRGPLKFSEVAGELVAGKPTRVTIISDPDGNALQKLWIHPESGLILRRTLLDKVGSTIGLFEFQKVNLAPRISAQDFKIVRAGARVLRPMDLAKRLAAEGGFAAVFIPASEGYTLEFSRVHKVDNHVTFGQTYSGKSGHITLYQFKGERLRDRGRRGHDTQLFSWEMNGRSFALVGRASLEELQRLAKVLGGP